MKPLKNVVSYIRESSGLPSTTVEPTCIYEDNAACIEHMKLGYIKGDNTKHILPKFFYNQQHQQFLNIHVNQVSSADNVADLFTKSLPKSTFEKHVKSIGMRRLSKLQDWVTNQGESLCRHQGESTSHVIFNCSWCVVLFFPSSKSFVLPTRFLFYLAKFLMRQHLMHYIILGTQHKGGVFKEITFLSFCYVS